MAPGYLRVVSKTIVFVLCSMQHTAACWYLRIISIKVCSPRTIAGSRFTAAATLDMCGIDSEFTHVKIAEFSFVL